MAFCAILLTEWTLCPLTCSQGEYSRRPTLPTSTLLQSSYEDNLDYQPLREQPVGSFSHPVQAQVSRRQGFKTVTGLRTWNGKRELECCLHSHVAASV
jgi:hypothetical protein